MRRQRKKSQNSGKAGFAAARRAIGDLHPDGNNHPRWE